MKKHFAVSGFVMNKEHSRLLMVYHKKMGIWVIPGGHLEENELPPDGAEREILEETGIKARILDYSELDCPKSDKEHQIANPYLTLYESIPEKGDKPAHVHIDLIFLAEADENEKLTRKEDEVNDAKWMTWSEVLESGTFESIKTFAKKMLDRGGDLACENSDL